MELQWISIWKINLWSPIILSYKISGSLKQSLPPTGTNHRRRWPVGRPVPSTVAGGEAGTVDQPARNLRMVLKDMFVLDSSDTSRMLLTVLQPAHLLKKPSFDLIDAPVFHSIGVWQCGQFFWWGIVPRSKQNMTQSFSGLAISRHGTGHLLVKIISIGHRGRYRPPHRPRGTGLPTVHRRRYWPCNSQPSNSQNFPPAIVDGTSLPTGHRRRHRPSHRPPSKVGGRDCSRLPDL